MKGRQFGRYRLLELLGQGGMGEVWRAHDTETDRIVALKVLHTKFAEDETFQIRFRREAHAAAGLIEPHVVPIHHYGEIDGRLYVDMRLIEGRSLDAFITDGPLDPARAVTIVEQVGAALNAAHKSGLVHRDVKPSNILVGELDFAYLIDFGIARAVDQSKLTQTGQMIGTWAYMAPERLSHGREDSRSDTYSLACVLYECLVGATPYPGHTVEQQVVGHLTAPPPRPSVTGHVSASFDGVIAKGMAKDPQDRYPTSYDLALAARSAITSSARMPLPPMPTTERRPRMPTPTPPPISASDPTQRGSAGGGYPRTGDDAYGRPAAAGQSLHSGSPYAAPYPHTPPPTPYSGAGGHYPPSDPGYGRASSRPAGASGLLRSERRRELSKRYAIPALVAIVILVIGSVVISQFSGGDDSGNIPNGGPNSPAETAPPKPTSVFDGIFTASFGPATDFDGAPKVDQPLAQTWSVKQSCGDVGCVANASLLNGQSASNTLVFDLIDGRWVAVAATPGTNCRNAQDEEWTVFSLNEEPDKTLTGEWREMSPGGFCATKRTVKLTRTGNPEGSVADPATEAARVSSPAGALFGKYRYIEYFEHEHIGEFVGQTFCLRTGQRCVAYLTNPNVGRDPSPMPPSYPMVFANGTWSVMSETTSPCPNGGGDGLLATDANYATPPQPQYPIAVMDGKATRRSVSGCSSAPYDFDTRIERIGD
jgi:serine/threonine protein kinase